MKNPEHNISTLARTVASSDFKPNFVFRPGAHDSVSPSDTSGSAGAMFWGVKAELSTS